MIFQLKLNINIQYLKEWPCIKNSNEFFAWKRTREVVRAFCEHCAFMDVNCPQIKWVSACVWYALITKLMDYRISCDNFALGHIWKITPDYNDKLGNYGLLGVIVDIHWHGALKRKIKKCGSTLSTLISEVAMSSSQLSLFE